MNSIYSFTDNLIGLFVISSNNNNLENNDFANINFDIYFYRSNNNDIYFNSDELEVELLMEFVSGTATFEELTYIDGFTYYKKLHQNS